MKKAVILLLSGFALGIVSFKTYEKIQNKPLKIYREGDSKVVVWENIKDDNTTWKSYQVEKEYKKDGVSKYTNSFNEKELIDLKKALNDAIADISPTKK